MDEEKREEDLREDDEDDDLDEENSTENIEDITKDEDVSETTDSSSDPGPTAEDAVSKEDTITGHNPEDTVSQPVVETSKDTSTPETHSHAPLPKTEEPTHNHNSNHSDDNSHDHEAVVNHNKPEEPTVSSNAPMEEGMGTGAHSGSDEHISINTADLWKYLKIIIVIAVLVFGYNYYMGDKGGVTGNVIAEVPAGNAPAEVAKVEVSIDDDAIKGDENAPVTIIEFSDYECPFCARFYSQTLSQIDEQYIKTGKVRLIYRDYPLSFHPQAQKAGEAAECAGEQGKYYEMHDMLFEAGVAGGVDSFKKHAGMIGLDQAAFDTCLDSGAQAEEVQKDFADGNKYGVQGTPAFFINGKLISGAQPFSVFEAAIEAELAS
jgi:protein-disulfide isomerase